MFIVTEYAALKISYMSTLKLLFVQWFSLSCNVTVNSYGHVHLTTLFPGYA